MKSSKKIIGASAALGLAVALSAGSTFAWFTGGNTNVSVKNFDIGVTTESDGADLQIAVGLVSDQFPTSTTDFGYSIDLLDNDYSAGVADLIADATNGDAPLKTLKPLTYNETDKKFYGSDWTGSNEASITEETAGMLKFRVILSSSVEMKITLSTDAAVSASVGSTGTPIKATATEPFALPLWSGLNGATYSATDGNSVDGVGGSSASDGVITARAANAARVLFEEKKTGGITSVWCPNEYYTDGAEFDGTTEVSGKTKTGTHKGFYKNNLASDYAYAVKQIKNGVAPGDVEFTVGAGTEGASEINAAYAKAKIKQREYSHPVVPGTTEIARLSDQLGSDSVISSYVGSNAGFFAVIDVTLWLEGTDGDCLDAVKNDLMNVVLAFKGEVVTGG